MTHYMDGEPPSTSPKPIPDPDRPRIVLHQDGSSESQTSLADECLDRVVKGPARRGSGNSDGSSDEAAEKALSGKAGSTRRRLRSLKDGAKRKTKDVVHAAKAKAGFVDPTPSDSAFAEIDNNPAFQPSHLIGNKRLTVGGTADKVLGTAYAAGKAIADPRNAAKRKAASKVAVKDRPYLSQTADAEYLGAHDDLERLQSSQTNSSDEEDVLFEIDEKQERIERLENIRDGRRVAWTTTKHLHRVMVVPKHRLYCPRREDFYMLDPMTGKTKLDWTSYILELNEYNLKSFALNSMGEVDPVPQQPFSRDIIMRLAERILIASSPWQSWFLSMRSIYRYEQPRKTLKWAAVWFVIWHMDFVMTFVMSYVVFIVLENKFSKKHVEYLRDSIQRGLGNDSHNARALRLNELIDRHGSANWLDPLLEEAGPLIQMQLSDFADFLEILSNFYAWRSPRRTWYTLFWFACAISLGVLTDTGYSMKIIYMFCYLSFFLGRPVASRYPQYRHIVNALKWIYWDIPTDASWAMMYLRTKAQETRARLIRQHVEERYGEQSAQDPVTERLGLCGDSAPDRLQKVPEIDIKQADGSLDDASVADSFDTAESELQQFEDIDLVSFKCRYHSVQGSLIIYSEGLRFVRASPIAASRKELWRRPFSELVELRKVNHSTAAKLIALENLELLFRDHEADDEKQRRRQRVPGASVRAFRAFRKEYGLHNYSQHHREHHHSHEDLHEGDDNVHDDAMEKEPDGNFHDSSLHDKRGASDALIASTVSVKLEGVRGRDRAFNCILGFSGLQFQVLHPLTTPELKAEKREKKERKGLKRQKIGRKIKEVIGLDGTRSGTDKGAEQDDSSVGDDSDDSVQDDNEHD